MGDDDEGERQRAQRVRQAAFWAKDVMAVGNEGERQR